MACGVDAHNGIHYYYYLLLFISIFMVTMKIIIVGNMEGDLDTLNIALLTSGYWVV